MYATHHFNHMIFISLEAQLKKHKPSFLLEQQARTDSSEFRMTELKQSSHDLHHTRIDKIIYIKLTLNLHRFILTNGIRIL